MEQAVTEQVALDMKWMVSEERGRRVLAMWVARSGALLPGTAGEAVAALRNFGLWILEEAFAADPIAALDIIMKTRESRNGGKKEDGDEPDDSF